MTDVFAPAERSRIMSRIRGKNTTPEIVLRRALWAEGMRYRIHDRSIPGTPDVSSRRKRLAIFVDGCFWHGCPKHYNRPGSNRSFWAVKLEKNRSRRRAVRRELRRAGWRIFEVWECTVRRDAVRVARRIVSV